MRTRIGHGPGIGKRGMAVVDNAGMFGEGLWTGLSVPLVSFDKLRMSGLFLLGWS